MMLSKLHQLVRVKYNKTTQTPNTTERTIIATYIPTPKVANVKALDVTDMSEGDQQTVESTLQEYATYLETQQNTIFSFENFAAHVGTTLPNLKWRTFKPDQLEEL